MSDYSLKKVLLQASIPPGRIDVVDGYRQRVLSMAKSLGDIGFNVRILWFYRLHDFFRIRSSDFLQTAKPAFYRPVLPFYSYPLLSKLSRSLARFWVKRLDLRYNFDCIQAETALHGCI